jgi:hypothetical protein
MKTILISMKAELSVLQVTVRSIRQASGKDILCKDGNLVWVPGRFKVRRNDSLVIGMDQGNTIRLVLNERTGDLFLRR